MTPRFVAQHAFAIPHPGWQAKSKSQHPPCIIVVAYLDADGMPWLYDDDRGLRRVPIPEDILASKK